MKKNEEEGGRKAEFQWEFAQIPAGEFMMGASPDDDESDSDEKPSHLVRITHSFELGCYPVTQGMWKSVMGSNPSSFKGKNRPVESVSWNDTQEFFKKLNDQQDGYICRLPTEAEWEYAARAGTTGPCYGDLHSIAWFYEDSYIVFQNSDLVTHPVGEKLPNQFGLYAMLGNVREWCQDWHDEEYYEKSPTEDPMGPTNGKVRVLRGGSWYDFSWDVRVSARGRNYPESSYNCDGFRVCREKL